MQIEEFTPWGGVKEKLTARRLPAPRSPERAANESPRPATKERGEGQGEGFLYPLNLAHGPPPAELPTPTRKPKAGAAALRRPAWGSQVGIFLYIFIAIISAECYFN